MHSLSMQVYFQVWKPLSGETVPKNATLIAEESRGTTLPLMSRAWNGTPMSGATHLDTKNLYEPLDYPIQPFIKTI